MRYQAVFQRHEIKFLLDTDQYLRITKAMSAHMAPDDYGLTTIRNIYYDTDDYRLIRHSMEKPIYKEKLRLRSYRQVSQDAPVFVELKKKYKGVVYKRRLTMPQKDAFAWFDGTPGYMPDSQIGRELEYFRRFYKTLHPTVFLSYDRVAWFCDSSDLRVTFDTNICYRTHDLGLYLPPGGTVLLPRDRVLMEVKTAGGIPLWMSGLLNRERIFKASYSKYANAYMHILKGEHSHVR